MQRLRAISGPISFNQWLHETVRAGLLLVLLPAVLVTVLYQYFAISHRFPLDYGEAPLVDQALRLAAWQNIYKPDLSTPPYTISNYPPLYVAALAPLVALFGPAFGPGRLLSALCAWVAAACLAVLVHTHSRDRWAAGVTALTFITIAYVTHWSGFLRVDLLALALSLLALAVLVRWPGAGWGLWVAGVLLAASVYTRQSYALAAPAAAFVWLWSTAGLRRALGLAALVGGLGLAAFLVLQLVTGGGFFFNIVTANVNEYRWDILERNLDSLRDNAWPLMGLGALGVAFGPRRNPLYALAVVYLAGGALSGLTVGKIGSNVNYLLEFCAGLCLVAGGLAAWARQQPGRAWLAAGVVAALALQAAYSLRMTLTVYASDLGDRRSLTPELYRLAALVAEADGPVLADEYMGLSTLAGQPLYLQPFEVTQLARAGVWDQAPLLASLDEQQFAMILLYDPEWSRERWTPEMLAMIEGNYRLSAHAADTRVYRPFDRQAAAVGETCPGAAWRLPTEAARGLQAEPNGLMFFGGGVEGALPVVAVADGRLTRRSDWLDAVAIEHEDPLQPGATVWTYYADLAGSNGLTSHIAPEFALGTVGEPVRAGQVVGFQGTWSGRKLWPTWVHARVAVVRGPAPGVFPEALTPEVLVDPAPYFNLEALVSGGTLRPLQCVGQ